MEELKKRLQAKVLGTTPQNTLQNWAAKGVSASGMGQEAAK
jgi:hypothetical protein